MTDDIPGRFVKKILTPNRARNLSPGCLITTIKWICTYAYTKMFASRINTTVAFRKCHGKKQCVNLHTRQNGFISMSMRQKNYLTINYCLNLRICQRNHLRNYMLIITVFGCRAVNTSHVCTARGANTISIDKRDQRTWAKRRSVV